MKRSALSYACLALIVLAAPGGCNSSDQTDASSGPSGPSRTSQSDGEVRTSVVDSPENQPDWAVPYAAAFWQQPTDDEAPDGDRTDGPADLRSDADLQGVVERVQSAFERGDDGGVRADLRAHRTSLQGPAMVVAPKLPNRGDGPETSATFETTGVRCGERAAAIDRGADWSVTGNTAQRRLHAELGAIEHVAVRTSGPEVVWRFGGAALESCDRLAVESRIEGLAYKTETEAGLHFADSTGRARLRVSHATVVDADGDRWERPVDHRGGGRLRVTVPRSVLAQADGSLAIDPRFHPEKAVDSPVDAARGVTPDSIRTASNGSNSLVVWKEISGPMDATRLSNAGKVLDPSGLAFDSSLGHYGDYTEPAVATDGSDYLVAWGDTRNAEKDIYGTRVDASDGSLIDGASGKGLATNSNYEFKEPALAFNGTDYLLVWSDERGGQYAPDVYGARLDSSADRVSTSDIEIGAAAENQVSPRVASDGSDFVIVWEDTRNSTDGDIYGARVESDGSNPNSPNGFEIETRSGRDTAPDVASDGSGYLVVWQDGGTDNDVLGATLSFSPGSLSPTISSPISIITADETQEDPEVAFGSSNYLVVWRDRRNTSGLLEQTIYGARVGTGGTVHDPSGFAISDKDDYTELVADVAFNGEDFVVPWDLSRPATPSEPLYATRVSTSGSVLDQDGILLNPTDNIQRHVDVAADGTRYLAVWRDNRDPRTSFGIYGVRLDETGTPVDTTAIQIADTPSMKEVAPSVASNGSNFLVVWKKRDSRPIYGKRVDPSNGQLLDSTPITINSSAREVGATPTVASNGSGYLVAWEHQPSDIYGARVTGSGTVQDSSGIAIVSRSSNNEQLPAIASNGTNYLVVWQDSRNYSSNHSDIFGTRVRASDGKVLTSGGFGIANTYRYEQRPTAASDGSNFLVGWEEQKDLDEKPEIHTVEVTSSGSVNSGTELQLTDNTEEDLHPQMVYGGRLYTLLWERNGTLYGGRIDGSTLEMLDPPSGSGPFAVHDGTDPALASVGASQFLAGYHRTPSSIGVDRAHTRAFYIDSDGDGVLEHTDNCPSTKNTGQANADGDQWGDACDPCENTAGPTCTINGTSCIAEGTISPHNPCEECQPDVNDEYWTIDASNSCDDGDVCTTDDSCTSSGTCEGSPQDCSHLDSACKVGVCSQDAGGCTTEPRGDTSISCDDGDPCTENDHCDGSGQCVGGGTVECDHLDSACQVGVCSQSAGGCTTEPRGDTSISCDDGDPCTENDHCDGSGQCVGGGTVECDHLDTECQVGVCSQAAGGCTTRDRPDGTECGDSRSCSAGTVTLQDTCRDGSCRDNGTEDCDPYAGCADESTCSTSCADDSDCATGYVCKESACEMNTAPTADAGPDQRVVSGTQVTLDATGSSDPDGDSLSYSWTQQSGPSVTLSDDRNATTSFTAPEVGTPTDLVFELEVDDGWAMARDSTTVTVEPTEPGDTGVDAGGSGDTGTSDGGGSSDASSSDVSSSDTSSSDTSSRDTSSSDTAADDTGDDREVDAGDEEADDGADATPALDGAREDSEVDRQTRASGCGCASNQSTPPVGGAFLALLVGLAGLGARRRRSG